MCRVTYHSLRLYNRMRQRRERPIEEKQLIEKHSKEASMLSYPCTNISSLYFSSYLSILRHEEDAKDVTQEVFVKFTLSQIINFLD